MTEQAHTPEPWYWDEYGQLSSKHGWPVIAAGINKAGGAYVAVNQEDKSVLAAAPELLEALESSGGWLAFVLKGINSGRISDQTVLDTTGSGPILGQRALSDILLNETHKVVAVIAKAKGEAS